MTSVKKRIEWVDAAKGIGILMVMFGHNWLDWKYCYYFYSFHMPLFFILAGYTFSDRRAPLEFIKQKAKVLLIPYIFFVLCNLVYYGLMSYTHGGSYDIENEAFSYLLQQRHTYLWFLPVLFLSELLVYLLSKSMLLSNLKKVVFTSITLVLLHFSTIITGNINLVWNLDLVPMASAFIILGFIYKKYITSFKLEASTVFISSLFIFSLFVSTINFIVWDRVDILGNSYGCLPLFYIGAITATYALILILKKVTVSRMLIILGVNSLLLYGLHRIVIEFFFIIWNKIGIMYDGISWVSLLIAITNVTLTTILLFPLISFINKKTPWLIGKF